MNISSVFASVGIILAAVLLLFLLLTIVAALRNHKLRIKSLEDSLDKAGIARDRVDYLKR